MKFYGKSITLVNANRSATFVFCRTDKKEELLKSKYGYQILSKCFPDNRYFLLYFLDIKILYVSLIAETLLSNCLKTFGLKLKFPVNMKDRILI